MPVCFMHKNIAYKYFFSVLLIVLLDCFTSSVYPFHGKISDKHILRRILIKNQGKSRAFLREACLNTAILVTQTSHCENQFYSYTFQ